MTRQLLNLCIIIVALAPLLLGTEPSLPPYQDFTVSGMLERPAGGSKEGFTVVLCGKSGFFGDSSFHILRGLGYSTNDRPIALTDSSGAFSLRVSSYEVDSLAVAVVVPDRPLELGERFFVDKALGTPHRRTYTSGTATGCAGCSTGLDVTERIEYYSYYYSNKNISITF